MLGKKKVVCIIPARLKSVRFPEKILQKIHDKPLLEWVWQAAKSVTIFDDCHFAIDSLKTAALIDSFGASWIMTSPDALSGTDRLVEIMDRDLISADIWVNWQGDEPFIQSTMIQELLANVEDSDIDIWTLKKKIEDVSQITSPNYAKVVTNERGRALYFSRSPIPFYRDIYLQSGLFYKHVGIYAFTTKSLQMIKNMKQSLLEDAEKLEQLRFLANGLVIQVNETLFDVRGIDIPDDLRAAEIFMTKKD